jgi:tetratricopeptide (TPR) repeat protein
MTHSEPPTLQRGALAAQQAYDTAVALHRLGQLRGAAQAYRTLLQAYPDHIGALHYLGVIAAQQGELDEAIRLIRRAIELDSNSAAAHNDLGVALAAHGRLEDAIAQYEQAVAIDANHIEAHNNLGVALLAAHRPEQAVAHFEGALAIRPESPEINNNLGNAFFAMGRKGETSARKAIADKPHLAAAFRDLSTASSAIMLIESAIRGYEKALALKPDYAEAHHNIANALRAVNRREEAIAHFHEAITLKPNFADLHNDLGNALLAWERNAEAIACFRKALNLKPAFAEASNKLGCALAMAGRNSEAVTHYQKALTIRPDFAEAHVNLGNALSDLNRIEDAVECYANALEYKPDFAEAYNRLGSAWQTLGRLPDSLKAFERAVSIAPRRANYYHHLVRAKEITPGDLHFEAMENLARDVASLADQEQMALHFALGAAYAGAAKHEQAFRHLFMGNAIRRKQIPYDEAAELMTFDRIEAAFTPEMICQKSGHGDPSDVPVFVVGMPRSGTTLVEQILASHPEIFGAGERPDLARAVKKLRLTKGTSHRLFPELVPSMTPAQLRDLGTRYVASIMDSAPNVKRIVDKMPTNFKFVGLIALIFSNARIIHVRRNPIDTCWSCFEHLFKHLEWSNDLGELGRYYRAYSRLMKHWRNALPDGTILDVQYEDLVSDFERQARRIVEYCGLEWNPRCLAFHETKRPILTTSAVQVRQPLYRSSVGRGRAYECWLGPLLEALGPMNEDFG